MKSSDTRGWWESTNAGKFEKNGGSIQLAASQLHTPTISTDRENRELLPGQGFCLHSTVMKNERFLP